MDCHRAALYLWAASIGCRPVLPRGRLGEHVKNIGALVVTTGEGISNVKSFTFFLATAM
jgi:hypothetical protein